MDKKIGRPLSGKKLYTLRLEGEIVDHFRSFGPGWLQRINDTLKRSMIQQKAVQSKQEKTEMIVDPKEIEAAKELISKAERDLGRTLSGGERRDLLADNSKWSSGLIRQVVLELEIQDTAQWVAKNP